MTFIEKTFGYDMWPHSLIHLVSQVFVVSKFKESDEGLCDSRNSKQGGFIRFETLLELPAHSGMNWVSIIWFDKSPQFVKTCGDTPSFILFLKFSWSPSSKTQMKVCMTVKTQNKAGLLCWKHLSCLLTVALNWFSIIWPIKLPKWHQIGR